MGSAQLTRGPQQTIDRQYTLQRLFLPSANNLPKKLMEEAVQAPHATRNQQQQKTVSEWLLWIKGVIPTKQKKDTGHRCSVSRRRTWVTEEKSPTQWRKKMRWSPPITDGRFQLSYAQQKRNDSGHGMGELGCRCRRWSAVDCIYIYIL